MNLQHSILKGLFALGLAWVFQTQAAGVKAIAAETPTSLPWPYRTEMFVFGGPVLKFFPTNLPFSTRVTLRWESEPNVTSSISGNLLFRDHRALFDVGSIAVESSKNRRSRAQSCYGIRVLYSSDSNATTVVCEDLSGFSHLAPVQQMAEPRIRRTAIFPSKERVSGLECIKTQYEVESASGAPDSYVVWEASEPLGCPIKIERYSHSCRWTMILSGWNLEVPPANLFNVSATEYRFYESLASMSGELTRRICDVSRGRPHTPKDSIPSVPETDMAKLPAVSYDTQRVINEMHLSALKDKAFKEADAWSRSISRSPR